MMARKASRQRGSKWTPRSASRCRRARSGGQAGRQARSEVSASPHVGHGLDPGRQRDLLPGQALGVAAPVVAPVVLADHGQGVAQRRGPPDDVGADDRVLLDPGPLVVAEGTGLVEDVVGDADLAPSCR
jgi:hypothetical protein